MIRKKSDSGWWEGELQVILDYLKLDSFSYVLNLHLQSKGRRRQLGWFPATYVKVLAGGKMSGRSTPLSSSKINLHETVIGTSSLLHCKLLFNYINFN